MPPNYSQVTKDEAGLKRHCFSIKLWEKFGEINEISIIHLWCVSCCLKDELPLLRSLFKRHPKVDSNKVHCHFENHLGFK